MKKYRVITGWESVVEQEINELSDSYTVQQITTEPNSDWSQVLVTALLRARSEETEPDPEDNWCLAKAKDGSRCLLDSVKDGLCKRHWREAAAKGLLGSG